MATLVFFRKQAANCTSILALVCVWRIALHSTRRWSLVEVNCRQVCNLLSLIDEVFVFTQVTIINMVATCFCFTMKI